MRETSMLLVSGRGSLARGSLVLVWLFCAWIWPEPYVSILPRLGRTV